MTIGDAFEWAWSPPPGAARADAHRLVTEYLNGFPLPASQPGSPDSWVASLEWIAKLPVGPVHSGLGRALLSADRGRRADVAVAAAIQRVAALRHAGNCLVPQVLVSLRNALWRSDDLDIDAHAAADFFDGIRDIALDTGDRIGLTELHDVVKRLAPHVMQSDAIQKAIDKYMWARAEDGLHVGWLCERAWEAREPGLRLLPNEPWARRVLSECSDTSERGATASRVVRHAQGLPARPGKRWTAKLASLVQSTVEPYEDVFARWLYDFGETSGEVPFRPNDYALRGLIYATRFAKVLPVRTVTHVALACTIAVRNPHTGWSYGNRGGKACHDAVRVLVAHGGPEGRGAAERVRDAHPNMASRQFIDRLLARGDG